MSQRRSSDLCFFIPNKNFSTNMALDNTVTQFVLAVPTFNRLDKLKILLGSIESQVKSSSYHCRLVISNSESTDGTYDFVSGLKPFGPISEIVRYNVMPDGSSRPDNWHNLGRIMPDSREWVWFLGDDDVLASPNCLEKLSSFIRSQDVAGVELFHLTQGRRSKGTRRMIRLNFSDALESFGLLELVGWMSSILIRADVLRRVLTEAFFDHDFLPSFDPHLENTPLAHKISAYRWSAHVVKECHNSEICIIDDYFADPQDESTTTETRQRWAEEMVALRYMFVIDDVEYLCSKGILRNRFSASFFRYHTGYLWDRFTHHVVNQLISQGELDSFCLALLARLVRIEALLANPAELHLFRLWRFGFFSAIEDALKQRQRYIETCSKLEEIVTLSFKGVYSFDTFQ